MLRKVKLQGTTYTWVDSLAVEQAVQQPSRGIALHFALSFAAFVLYLAALVIVVLEDTQVSEAHLVSAGMRKAVERFDGVATREDLAPYLRTVVGGLVVWPDPDAEYFELPKALGSHALVGSVRVVQHRAAKSWECTDSVMGTVPCEPDFDATQMELEARPDAPAFIGPRTLLTFPYVPEHFPCPPGLTCASGTTSRIRPADIFYPDSGYALELYGPGAASTGSTGADDSMGAGIWVNGTRTSLPAADVLSDFLDPRTRHVRVTGVFFNAQLHLFTQLNVHFELPVTGGVFPFVTTQFLALIDRSEQAVYFSAEVYLWLFTALTTLDLLWRVVKGCRRTSVCLRCAIKGKPTTVTRCLSCSKPLPTHFVQPEECSWCTAVMPPVEHTCWRRTAQNPWCAATLGLNLLFLVARLITIGARWKAVELVRAATIATAQHQIAGGDSRLPADASVLFAPVAQIASVSNDFLAAALMLAFVRSYRYIGRFEWARKFLRVFSSGGVLIGLFFITFAIVFAGFGISFHLLLGEDSDRFTSLSAAMRTTFFALIMVVDWIDLRSPNATGWIDVVVYVVFVFSCALVMLNVLISVVTYEYKLSVQAKSADVESKSLLLLIRPIVARVTGNRYRRNDGRDTAGAGSHGPAHEGGNAAAGGADDDSSDVPEQAGMARTVVSADREGLHVADDMERADMTAQLVGDALRSVRGLTDVVESASLTALRHDVAALRRDLRATVKLARRCAGEPDKGRSRGKAASGMAHVL
uniref:Polycystin cation channel PKD1/PKD2 domain-containing protein n=1 Tax=Neobodo designis TaxID=312471 RepID=A0A7S1M9Q6_NEODS|mmetsp:Transcript_3680/g.11604  ORF Transcript_3680/g.11604 Transcript_3680/m.11604 type:complete len:756 (+) Transcript_3680:25-2292(+)